MTFTVIDVAIFVAFFAVVLGLSLYQSRGRQGSEQYFLGGRSLPWWLIGVSVVAANISTEQFVGMAGQAAGNVGLAVASWQLVGTAGIVFGAFFFLPRFLRAGIFTIPEFLEYRYNTACRVLMSLLTVIVYAAVTSAAVLYSGATALETIFEVNRNAAVAMIAAIALGYVLWGGLLAAVWADLLQGSALLVGGLATIAIGVWMCGGPGEFYRANAEKMHLLLPQTHEELPWRVLVSGMWIPIIYYCGLNQFIMQRSLAAKSLRDGQLGVIFAGALWLLVPLAVVMPGIVAHQLYGKEIQRIDQAYPLLVRHLIPQGLRGFIFAALAGAVISSLASMLNSASTIFTIDLYKRLIDRQADERRLVLVGRLATVVCLAAACAVAVSGALEGGVFKFIQEFQGYVSPGIVAAFVFGLAVRRAPPAAGLAALLLSAPIYGVMHFFGVMHWLGCERLVYLDRMFLTLIALLLVMTAITVVRPLPEPRSLPVRRELETRPAPLVIAAGAAVLAGVAAYYILFA